MRRQRAGISSTVLVLLSKAGAKLALEAWWEPEGCLFQVGFGRTGGKWHATVVLWRLWIETWQRYS